VLTDDEKALLIFERSYKSEKIIIVINNGELEQTLDIPDLENKCVIDLLSSKKFDIDDKKIVAGKWGLILKTCS